MPTQRTNWNPEQEHDDAGFLNGCLQQDDYDRETVETLQSSAVSFSTLYASGEMPVIKWDEHFENYLKRRGEVIEDMMRDQSRTVWPWEVLKNLPKNQKNGETLYFSQGNRPSCMGHADDFAYRSSLLSCIGTGSPLIYEPTNPYVTWVLSKNGSQRGGQSPGPMAEASNQFGHYLASQVGDDNLNMPKDYERHSETARRHQSAIVFIPGEEEELAQRITKVNRAGLGVAMGNSLAVSGTMIDANKVELAELSGRWAHATSTVAWMKKNGQEYVFWVNSHGKQYKKSTFGEPFDGAWMRPGKELVRFVKSATMYGQPYAVLPEAIWIGKTSLEIGFDVLFPTEWIG